MTATPSLIVMTDDEVARFGRRPDAGFGALACEHGVLPLAAMEVDARVAGVIASIDIAQTFVNTSGHAIEATYIFPLPDRAAVHRFRMEVGGRVIDGVIDERGAARATYDQAIAAGHRASIAEQERPGVFTLRVGNLMAGEVAVVRLSLVGPLAVDDGEVTLQFPLVVAPRFISGFALGGEQAGLGAAGDTDRVPDASRISPPVLLAGFTSPVRLAIRVALGDHDVREVVSSLHAIVTTHRDAKVIEIRPGDKLDRDFILRWRVAPGAHHALGSALTCADDADGRAGTFMLTLVPPSSASLAFAGKPRDVVFVLDRSGSMQGWKMVAARRAAARMIATLSSRDRFAAIAFDDRIDVVPELGLVDATDHNRHRAAEALAEITARGGTELATALEHAADLLGAPYESRERVIVLVTDGQIGNEDDVLSRLAPRLRGTRVFTLGIDHAVNAGFLRRFASLGGGACELVESEDRLDAVMDKVHRRIGTPIASGLALHASRLDVDVASYAPARMPDVYAGSPVTILGRYRGRAASGAAIDISAASLGESLRERVVRDPDTTAAAAWLGACWARARIRELEDRYAAGDTRHEAAIVATSLQFGVLSRFTAFVAVDRAEVANKDGRLTQVVQPVERPAAIAASDGDREDALLHVSRARTSRAMPTPIVLPSPAAPMGAPMPITMSIGAAMQGPTLRASQPVQLSESLRVPPPLPPVIIDASAYLARLAELATLLAAATAPQALQMIRQRLDEWIEDARSVGKLGELERLAAAVERLIAKLSATSAHDDVAAIAAALGKLGAGEPPPARPSRLAFWK